MQGYNDLATTNPELLKDWDYEENDKLGIKPNEITNGGKKKYGGNVKKVINGILLLEVESQEVVAHTVQIIL